MNTWVPQVVDKRQQNGGDLRQQRRRRWQASISAGEAALWSRHVCPCCPGSLRVHTPQSDAQFIRHQGIFVSPSDCIGGGSSLSIDSIVTNTRHARAQWS